MRNFLMTTLAFFAMASACSALTVAEYNGLDSETQARALAQTAVGTHNYLGQNGASQDFLNCIREYFTAREVRIEDELVMRNQGVEDVLAQIRTANRNGETDLRVEDLVLGSINNRCGEP